MSSLRLDALSAWEGWQREGVLYQWNGDLIGKWPDVRLGYGLDCSGFICAGILVATKGRVDWRHKWTSDRMHKELPCTAHPKPGDLVVYGTAERANHVMVWVGDGRVLGACGGDSGTTTAALARARGARVQYRPRADYRKRRAADGTRVSDFLGFRINQPLDG